MTTYFDIDRDFYRLLCRQLALSAIVSAGMLWCETLFSASLRNLWCARISAALSLMAIAAGICCAAAGLAILGWSLECGRCLPRTRHLAAKLYVGSLAFAAAGVVFASVAVACTLVAR